MTRSAYGFFAGAAGLALVVLAVGLIACGLYLWAIGSLVVTAVRIGAAGSGFMSRLSQHAHPTGLASFAEAT